MVPSLGPRVVLLLHSPPLEPGPPALLFPTRSISTAFVGSNAGGVGEGQSGGWGVQAGAQGAGHSGAGLWAPRLPDEGALPGSTTPPPTPEARRAAVRAFAPFFTQAAVSTSVASSTLSLEIVPAPRGRWTHSRGGGGTGLGVCVCACMRACMLAGVLKSGALVKELGWLGSV